MAKILLAITVLLLAGSAVLGFLNKSKLDETAGNLESTKGQLVASQTATKEAEAATKQVEELLAAEVTKREAAEAEAVANKQAADEAAAKVAKLSTELEEVKEKLIAAGNVDTTGEGGAEDPRLAELEAEKAELETALAAAEKEMTLLADKFQVEQATAQSLRDAETRRKGGILAKQLEGQVLAYNPAWNFVVIDLGDRQGMVNNAEMVIMRGANMIGRIRVSSVEPSSSIADVVPSSMTRGLQIQPGDRVVHPRS